MRLKDELLKDFSKAQMVFLAQKIGPNQEDFDELIRLFLDKDQDVSKRAAWLVGHCTDNYPWLIDKHIKPLLQKLQKNANDPVKRNSLRSLISRDIPDELLGIAADICFKYLNSAKEPIAIKAHAMSILYNITRKYPELKDELKLSIEELLPFGSAGIKSRGNKILKALEKL